MTRVENNEVTNVTAAFQVQLRDNLLKDVYHSSNATTSDASPKTVMDRPNGPGLSWLPQMDDLLKSLQPGQGSNTDRTSFVKADVPAEGGKAAAKPASTGPDALVDALKACADNPDSEEAREQLKKVATDYKDAYKKAMKEGEKTDDYSKLKSMDKELASKRMSVSKSPDGGTTITINDSNDRVHNVYAIQIDQDGKVTDVTKSLQGGIAHDPGRPSTLKDALKALPRDKP